MNIIIIGFGNMGCRHTQSLLPLQPDQKLYVLEPNEDVFTENSSRINAPVGQLVHIKSIGDIHFTIDFCIIATSSQPRYDLMLAMLSKGVRKFLVEKVVFQSATQFKDIINLMEVHQAQAWCNFVNRYFSNYQNIKELISRSSEPITMTVTGGDFGLGCNALHYVDLFEFLTNHKASLINYDLIENDSANRRGAQYKEILGTMRWETKNKDLLFISADKMRIGGNEISIIQDNRIDILNEETLQHLQVSDTKSIIKKRFEIQYTSTLTRTIYNDIMQGYTLLPTIQETENSHIQLFQAVNKTLKLNEKSLCPIT